MWYPYVSQNPGRSWARNWMPPTHFALSLGLSASTGKHYVETAMRKAGVTSRVSLAMWLRDHEEGAG